MKLSELSADAQDLYLQLAGYEVSKHRSLAPSGSSWGYSSPMQGYDGGFRSREIAKDAAIQKLGWELKRAQELAKTFPSLFKDASEVAPTAPPG